MDEQALPIPLPGGQWVQSGDNRQAFTVDVDPLALLEGVAMAENDLIEALSAAEHASWARWMKYLFSMCTHLPDGRLVIPGHLVVRWERQSMTDYADLSEQEKESDRKEVAHILPIIRQFVGGK